MIASRALCIDGIGEPSARCSRQFGVPRFIRLLRRDRASASIRRSTARRLRALVLVIFVM